MWWKPRIRDQGPTSEDEELRRKKKRKIPGRGSERGGDDQPVRKRRSEVDRGEGDQGEASSSIAHPADTVGSDVDAGPAEELSEEILASALWSRLVSAQRGPLPFVDWQRALTDYLRPERPTYTGLLPALL